MARRVSAFVGNVSPKSNYVFYQHLLENPLYSGLADKVKSNYAAAFNTEPTEPDMEIVERLKAMAVNERNKETDFIEFTFGTRLNYELNAQNSKDFIDAFNAYMQLQNVYEARKTLLMHGYGSEEFTQSLKDAYSYYPSYFATIFENNIGDIAQDIVNLVRKNVPFEEALAQVLKNEIPSLIDATTDKLSQADGNQGLDDEKKEQVRIALREISNAINSFGKTRFGQMAMNALNLDKINRDTIEEMKTWIQEREGKVWKRDVERALKKSISYYKSSRGVHSLGGNMAEVIENVSLSTLTQGLSKTGKNAKVFATGKTGMAADNVMVVAEGDITLETEEINKLLEQGKKTSRAANMETVSQLENILDRGNSKGFIVYSSDKNYLQVRKSKKGGFYESSYSAGGAQSLRLFVPILEEATHSEGRASVLMQGIMQTLKGPSSGGPGAIGEGDKQYMEQRLAQYFAYFLFDDLEFLGQSKIDGSSYQKIHLLNLNGIYVPLSVFLSLYAEALLKQFNEARMKPTAFAKVTISSPGIEFDYYANNKKPAKAWTIQREAALDKTQVHLYFLRQLRDVLDGITP